MPCDVYTDLTVNGTLHGHSQRDKRIRLISTLSLPLMSKREGEDQLAHIQLSRHLPMPLMGNHTPEAKENRSWGQLTRVSSWGNHMHGTGSAIGTLGFSRTHSLWRLLHFVWTLLIHCHLTFCLSAPGSLSGLPKKKKKTKQEYKKHINDLIIRHIVWILLSAPHAINKPCELFDIQPFLTFQSSNSIWFNLTHAVSSA